MGTNRRRDYPQEIASDLAGVKGETITLNSPAVANTEFLIIHNLRRVPKTLQLLRSQVPGSLYASRVGEWTNRRAYAKFSGAADSLTVRIA
jgi:hypothetical protein